MNNVNLIGRLTSDVDLSFMRDGTALGKVTLAVNKNLSKEVKEKFEKEGKPTADFINIVVWGKMAQALAEYVGKGNRLSVIGSIETDSFEDKDTKRRVYITQVNARELHFIDFKENKR